MVEQPSVAGPHSGGLRVEQPIDRLDHIAHGAHRLEFLGGNLLAGLALDMVDQVDGIDAVDLQVLIKVGFQADALRLQLKQFDQRLVQEYE